MAETVDGIDIQGIADRHPQRVALLGERENVVTGGQRTRDQRQQIAGNPHAVHIDRGHAKLVRQQLGKLHGLDAVHRDDRVEQLGRRGGQVGVLVDAGGGGVELVLSEQTFVNGQLDYEIVGGSHG